MDSNSLKELMMTVTQTVGECDTKTLSGLLKLELIAQVGVNIASGAMAHLIAGCMAEHGDCSPDKCDIVELIPKKLDGLVKSLRRNVEVNVALQAELRGFRWEVPEEMKEEIEKIVKAAAAAIRKKQADGIEESEVLDVELQSDVIH